MTKEVHDTYLILLVFLNFNYNIPIQSSSQHHYHYCLQGVVEGHFVSLSHLLAHLLSNTFEPFSGGGGEGEGRLFVIITCNWPA